MSADYLCDINRMKIYRYHFCMMEMMNSRYGVLVLYILDMVFCMMILDIVLWIYYDSQHIILGDGFSIGFLVVFQYCVFVPRRLDILFLRLDTYFEARYPFGRNGVLYNWTLICDQSRRLVAAACCRKA